MLLDRAGNDVKIEPGSAYLEYQPVLYGALGGLAKRGYPVPPDEALDIIHDFFLDSWTSVEDSYDETKGSSFKSYLYMCFVSFARRRLSSLVRVKYGLMDPMSLASVSDNDLDRTREASAGVEQLERQIDAAKIKGALAALPDYHRAVLWDYVSSPELSERRLAERYAVSRYRIREVLADAFGWLVVNVDPGDLALPALDGRIAVAIWRDRRTPGEAADLLSCNMSDIQSVKLRLLQALSDVLKGEKMSAGTGWQTRGEVRECGPKRKPNVIEGRAMHEFLQKLSRWLCGQLDEDLIAEIIEKRVAIMDELVSSDVFDTLDHAQIDTHRLEIFYAALGEGLDAPTDDDNVLALQSFRASEDQMIGGAFADLLLPGLQSHLRDFASLFAGADRVPHAIGEELARDVSVVAGGPKALELAVYGVTPVILATACRGISDLLWRYWEDNDLPFESQLPLGRDGDEPTDGLFVPRLQIARQVQLVTTLPDSTAVALYDWLAQVAEYHHFLFVDFNARLWDNRFVVSRYQMEGWTVLDQWAPPMLGAKSAIAG